MSKKIFTMRSGAEASPESEQNAEMSPEEQTALVEETITDLRNELAQSFGFFLAAFEDNCYYLEAGFGQGSVISITAPQHKATARMAKQEVETARAQFFNTIIDQGKKLERMSLKTKNFNVEAKQKLLLADTQRDAFAQKYIVQSVEQLIQEKDTILRYIQNIGNTDVLL